MPPRKRTSQSKPTSPTASTSHASADHQHHLRHAGPSISARAAASATPSKPPPPQPAPKSKSPPNQKGHDEGPLAEGSPPSTRASFAKFMYGLLFVAFLLLAWHVYGIVTLVERPKEELGWWGVIVGDSGGMARQWETWRGWVDTGRKGDEGGISGGDVEVSLNALADALGISPVQVASAVKPVVPEASLASVAAKTEETGRSEAVRVLFEDTG